MKPSVIYEFRVGLDEGGDPAALGGAVTAALCGHWDHEPPCRWPHHTATSESSDELQVLVEAEVPAPERDEVARRIGEAAGVGRRAGPDGRVTTWHLLTAITPTPTASA